VSEVNAFGDLKQGNNRLKGHFRTWLAVSRVLRWFT